MDKVSINIKIGDRTYPLKVDPSEVERLKKYSKILNAKIREFRDKFGIDDMQDLLAMVAFDTTINAASAPKPDPDKAELSSEELGSKITQLSELIDSLQL